MGIVELIGVEDVPWKTINAAYILQLLWVLTLCTKRFRRNRMLRQCPSFLFFHNLKIILNNNLILTNIFFLKLNWILKIKVKYQIHILFGSLLYSTNSLSSLSFVMFTIRTQPPELPSLAIARDTAIYNLTTTKNQSVPSTTNSLHSW